MAVMKDRIKAMLPVERRVAIRRLLADGRLNRDEEHFAPIHGLEIQRPLHSRAPVVDDLGRIVLRPD